MEEGARALTRADVIYFICTGLFIGVVFLTTLNIALAGKPMLWLKSRTLRRCMETYWGHCYHYKTTMVVWNTTCFEDKAQGKTYPGYFYECCRCHCKTRPKRQEYGG